MRFLSFVVPAALALSLSAPALADDPEAMMANVIGNTIVVVNTNGLESHTHYRADHTFDGVVPAMDYHYKGTWAVTPEGQLCSTFDPAPPGIVNPRCNPMGMLHVGDTWTSADGGKGQLVEGIN
jgi:hypothetical protein